MTDAGQPAKGAAATRKRAQRFSEVERDAMKNRAKELKAEARAGKDKAEAERALQVAFAEMRPADRAMAERIHAIVTASDPALEPKTWYGMPAYARGGKIVCFFQPAEKFKSRYATFGFNEDAQLDDGRMWPVAFAITELTESEEARIAALVKKAAG